MKSLGFFRLNAANLQPGVIDLSITHMSIFRRNTYVFVCWPKYVRFYQKSNRTYKTSLHCVAGVAFRTTARDRYIAAALSLVLILHNSQSTAVVT